MASHLSSISAENTPRNTCSSASRVRARAVASKPGLLLPIASVTQFAAMQSRVKRSNQRHLTRRIAALRTGLVRLRQKREVSGSSAASSYVRRLQVGGGWHDAGGRQVLSDVHQARKGANMHQGAP